MNDTYLSLHPNTRDVRHAFLSIDRSSHNRYSLVATPEPKKKNRHRGGGDSDEKDDKKDPSAPTLLMYVNYLNCIELDPTCLVRRHVCTQQFNVCLYSIEWDKRSVDSCHSVSRFPSCPC